MRVEKKKKSLPGLTLVSAKTEAVAPLGPPLSRCQQLVKASVHTVRAAVNSRNSTQTDFPHQLHLVFTTGKQIRFLALLFFFLCLTCFN